LGLLRVASWIVPGGYREVWRARRSADLKDYWLRSRGPDPDWEHTPSEYVFGMFAHAISERFAIEPWRGRTHRAGFVFLAAAVLFGLTGVLSRGYPATTALLHMLGNLMRRRPAGAGDTTVVDEGLLILFALLVGCCLVAFARPPLHRYNWRYWSFLAAKLAMVLVLLPVLWLEATLVVRELLSNSALRLILGGLLPGLLFIVLLGCSLIWCFSDQRQRCPVCLRRLALPVKTGSWSSIFEPASMELLCEEGHGSLILPENMQGPSEHWTELPPHERPPRRH
jgi:hypothetical protein